MGDGKSIWLNGLLMPVFDEMNAIFTTVMGKIIKRKPYVNKKSLYRKLAEARKAKWADKYQLQNEDPFKFHFCKGEQSENVDQGSSTFKGDHKADQRVKNRLAAQESREKKRYYVEELERKLELYEEMLETQTCRQCQGSLRDKSDTDLDLSEEKMELKQKQMKVDDYFQQGVIRVDNQGASSPFAIFFFLCFIVVLTIFTYRSEAAIDNRLLSNFDALLHQSLQKQSDETVVSALQMKMPLNHMLNSNALSENPFEKRKEMDEDEKTWRKFGDLLCTKVSPSMPLKAKAENSPFLMLRTAEDKENQPTQESEQEETWEKGDVLTCIISE